LRREYTLRESGDLLMRVVERTISGRLTCAEAMGHREFVITKLYPSA
jgi:(2R)-sulfolactate sulfo-lyase subunit beta